MKIIHKYIILEMINPFFMGLAIFTFVLLMDKILNLTELVVNKGVPVTTVGKLIFFLLPSFFVLTIPMAVLVATLMAFGRLSTDSEVIALRASGVSLYSLFVPVMIFSLLATLITFLIYVKALPWGNYSFRLTLYNLARTKAAIGIKERVFNSTFEGLDIYVDEVLPDGSFKGVMIGDSRDPKDPQIIFAKRGVLLSDPDSLKVILRLYDANAHPRYVSSILRYKTINFPVSDFVLNLQKDTGGFMELPQSDRDMTVGRLYEMYTKEKQAGRRYYSYLIELHKRFSIPIACFIFSIIGTPLGITSKRAGKSGGFAVSIGLILIYYIFITGGENLGDQGKISAILAAWAPNALLGGIGAFLLVRMAKQ
jgi:lipopolysaccharide export system permease protein